MSYIKKSAVMKICEDYSTHCFNSNDSNGQDIADRILDDVVELPIYAVVPISVYEQVKWERDLAIEQLQSYGVGFAEKKELEEVKHGYWKDRYDNKYYNHLYECSVCGKEALYESYKNELDQWTERQALTPICPKCGAKMDSQL